MEKEILEFVNAELLVLVPVLYVLGVMLKNTLLVKDKFIPLILGGVGVVLAVVWVLATNTITTTQEALQAVFTAFTQGILTTGAAVYINQAIVVQPTREE
jgi:hypothetical protein